jgi:hypothetical protein
VNTTCGVALEDSRKSAIKGTGRQLPAVTLV